MTQFTGAFPAPSWSPPAREPFVPLRPLTLGQILGGAFRALRHNPAVVLPSAILLSLIATLGGVLIEQLLVDPLVDRWGSGTGEDAEYLWFSAVGAGVLSTIVGGSLTFSAGIVQQSVSAIDVSHAVIGRRLTLGGARRRAKGLAPRVFGWALLALAVALALGALGLAVLAVAASAGALAAIAAGFVLYPAAAVLMAWLGTKLAFVPSVLVVERVGIGAAIGRSWRLTRQQFWRTFGIRILCAVMIAIATGIVALPIDLLLGWATGIVAPNGGTSDAFALQRIGELVSSVVGSVIVGIGLVITTATDALLYLELRMRKEGLDLELSRFMEHRRSGTRFDPNEQDPFRGPLQPAARPGSPAASTHGPGTNGASPWT